MAVSGTPRYLLDTNAASVLIRGLGSQPLQDMVIEYGACISVITEAELRFGIARRPDATRLAKAVENFLQDIPVLPWTSATAKVFAALRARMEIRGLSLSAMDLLIAAHALAENCTLASADKVFAHVPGLRVLDWSASPATKKSAKSRKAS